VFVCGCYANDQLFRVAKDGKYGYVNRKGELAVPLIYDFARPYSEGIAVVEEDNHSFAIDSCGEKVKDFGRHIFSVTSGFVPTTFSEGCILGYTPHGKAFFDHDWKQLFGQTFEDACHFSNGLASVKINGRWGAIDRTGTLVVTNQYDSVGYFSDGVAPVLSEQKFGAVNDSGEVLVPLEYKYVGGYSSGLMPALIGKKQWVFIDAQGRKGIDQVFELAYSFTEGKACVEVNGKFGFIDLSGDMVIEPQYDWAYEFSDGLAAVQVGEKWGFIDHSGKMVIQPQFDELPNHGFMNGLAEVEVDGKNGYIDKHGNYVWLPSTFWK